MFYYISGKLAFLNPNFAVVDAGGVGYKMTISYQTFAELSKQPAPEPSAVKLYSHMAVREDDIELFGFATEEELASFKLLITVSGVGPKAAISILSELTSQKLHFAICSDDKKAISKANGIGPKTAARIILELKDKLKRESSFDASALSGGSGLEELSLGGQPNKEADALDALTVLGYSRSDASNALREIDIANTELDDIIRLALKKLMR